MKALAGLPGLAVSGPHSIPIASRAAPPVSAGQVRVRPRSVEGVRSHDDEIDEIDELSRRVGGVALWLRASISGNAGDRGRRRSPGGYESGAECRDGGDSGAWHELPPGSERGSGREPSRMGGFGIHTGDRFRERPLAAGAAPDLELFHEQSALQSTAGHRGRWRRRVRHLGRTGPRGGRRARWGGTARPSCTTIQ